MPVRAVEARILQIRRPCVIVTDGWTLLRVEAEGDERDAARVWVDDGSRKVFAEPAGDLDAAARGAGVGDVDLARGAARDAAGSADVVARVDRRDRPRFAVRFCK